VVVQIGQNFTASTLGIDSLALPPDPDGAAGPNHFVELINGRFSVYRKVDGHRVQSLTDLAFWAQAGISLRANWDVSDPRIVFDPTVQRWFASAIEFDSRGVVNSNFFLLAISAGADPTGSWQGVTTAGDASGVNFADFPTLGLDSNGVYLGGDLFDASQNDVGSTLVSIPKADLLATPPVVTRLTRFGVLGYSSYGIVLQPAVNFDAAPGDAAVLAIGNLGLDLNPHSTLKTFAIHNAAGPGSALITPATTVDVPTYSVPLNPTQPDGNNTLDDGDTRIGAIVRCVGGVFYAVHGTEVSQRAAIRWYQIGPDRRTVLRSGTISDSHLDLFYPSIAANPSGTVVIAFNGCSTNTYVSSYAVVGETVNGVTTFGAPLLLKAGSANYQNLDPANAISRWGDYSATCLDPADPNRFWTIQMIASATDVWSTQVTELLTCVPVLSITLAGPDAVISWPGTAVPFDLESKTDLAASAWTAITQGLSTNNGQVYARVPLASGARFFRLHLR
jgi:hypothetical protein